MNCTPPLQKNVITGVGHFISWLTEILVFVTIQVIVLAMGHVRWSQIHWDWFFFMLWPSINYVVFPTVQVLTAKELRHHVFGWMRPGSECGQRAENEGAGGGGAEHIEMKDLNRNVVV